MPTLRVFTLAWDSDGGCGCEVFSTLEARDRAFRDALLTYVNHRIRSSADTLEELRKLPANCLAEELDARGCLDGVRFALDVQTVDFP